MKSTWGGRVGGAGPRRQEWDQKDCNDDHWREQNMNNLDYGEDPEEKQETLLKEPNIGNLAGVKHLSDFTSGSWWQKRKPFEWGQYWEMVLPVQVRLASLEVGNWYSLQVGKQSITVMNHDHDDIDDFDDGFPKERTFRVVMKWLSINTELWCLVVATVIAMTMIIIETDCWSWWWCWRQPGQGLQKFVCVSLKIEAGQR